MLAVGMSSGIVIRKTICTREAQSIVADSYSPGSRPVITAR